MAYRPPTKSFPSESKTRTETGNWSSFGKRQKPEPPKTEAKAPVFYPKNSLMSYMESQGINTTPAPADKWEQSALRRKKTPPPPPVKPFEEQFPSLGSSKIGPVAAPKPVLSMAERMRQKLKEEEEERQRKEAEEALARQGRKKENLHVVSLRHINQSYPNVAQMDAELEEDYDGLDYDVYGRNESSYAGECQYPPEEECEAYEDEEDY